MIDELEQEAKSISEHLEGKSISKVLRPRNGEVCIECTDGTRLFASSNGGECLEFSITGAASE